MAVAMHPVAVARRMVERYGYARAEWRIGLRACLRKTEYRYVSWDRRRSDETRAAFLVIYWEQVHENVKKLAPHS